MSLLNAAQIGCRVAEFARRHVPPAGGTWRRQAVGGGRIRRVPRRGLRLPPVQPSEVRAAPQPRASNCAFGVEFSGAVPVESGARDDPRHEATNTRSAHCRWAVCSRRDPMTPLRRHSHDPRSHRAGPATDEQAQRTAQAEPKYEVDSASLPHFVKPSNPKGCHPPEPQSTVARSAASRSPSLSRPLKGREASARNELKTGGVTPERREIARGRVKREARLPPFRLARLLGDRATFPSWGKETPRHLPRGSSQFS